MITKASELLQLFIQEETKKIADVPMPHMPTLGSAYEEITKQGVGSDFAIPKSLRLRVVSGFISVGTEILPQQIDCMLVHGDGKEYGLTSQYIYDIENVLCIFEVKKTLKKGDYADAIAHLAAIRKQFAEYFEHKLINEGFDPDITVARRHFAQMTGKIAPEHYQGMHDLPEEQGMLFYCLIQESLAPISIIHGYGGYKTEQGLRSAFIDILTEVKQTDETGIGIPSMPSLVTSGEFSIVKCNGMPFLAIKDDDWVAIASTRYNSAKMILELIWTKISAYFNVKMPWNDELEMDTIEPLLTAKAIRKGDIVGWMYTTTEPKEKHLKRDNDIRWKPELITEAAVTAVQLMAMRGGYLPAEDRMNEYFNNKYKVSLDKIIEALIRTRLFMKDQNDVRPIHRNTLLLINDDETGYVSNERDRFDIWCDENNIPKSYIVLYFVD